MTKAKAGDAEQGTGILEIVGADANNLRHVDVHIPLDQVTVITGVSGSGKSSLLADTLAAEAGRRMRLFLGIHQPHIEGAPPRAFVGPMPASIHVGQRAFRASVRTTVATATGLLTTLRRLFVSCARPYAGEVGRWVPAPSPASYAAWLVKHYRGQATVWAAPVRFVATDGVRCAERLRALGIHEVIVRSETDTARRWETRTDGALAKFKPAAPHGQAHHRGEASARSRSAPSRLHYGRGRCWSERSRQAQGQVVIELPEATQPELRGPFGPRLDSHLHHVDPDRHLLLPADLAPPFLQRAGAPGERRVQDMPGHRPRHDPR